MTSRTRRGLRGWMDPRGRGVQGWAFIANRVTGLMLVGYLYLHLGVLSLLARGPSSWDSFLAVARSPVVLAFDVVLFAAAGWHGLNGIRLALVGTGVAVRRQRAMLAGSAALLVIGLTIVAFVLFGEG
jgi:succinate dehydrogenase / fumarate reductase, cytochrome b subunit